MSCCERAEVPPNRKEYEMKVKAKPTVRWIEYVEYQDENHVEVLEYMFFGGVYFCRWNLGEWEPVTGPVPTPKEA
jgi:hypothetical protein